MDVSRYYKNVVDMLPDGIVALDLQGKIVSISQQLVLLLGLPQQSSATGHSFIEFIQEQERARFQHELDTYIQRNRKNHPLRHYIKRQDHTLYLADIYVSFLYDQQEVSGILLLIRDISHQDRESVRGQDTFSLSTKKIWKSALFRDLILATMPTRCISMTCLK